MRLLFTFAGGWGHAEPLMPLARTARERGHDVRFSAQERICAEVEHAGFPCAPSGPGTVRTEPTPLQSLDAVHEQQVMRDVFAGFIAAGRAQDLGAVAREVQPDVIVCDEVDFGAMVVAEAMGVPHASVVVLAAGTFLRPERVAEPLDQLRASWGLGPDPAADMLARHLVLAPGPPSFRHPGAALPSTGTWMQPAVWSRAAAVPSGRPLVYVTLGTIFNLESGDLFSRVVEGVRALEVDVLVTVGPHVDPSELGPQPPNVQIESFVPQAEVLPRCAAVVCHGGSGSVVGALSCGMPLVVIPMGADQPDNAARCEALGVGITLDVMTATPADIRQAVKTALGEPTYRAAAARLQAEVASLPDAAAALDRIESLV